MPSARATLGRLGEDAAARHLVATGYTLIARNWRCASGELDLVARQGDQMVFVEVKTRRGSQSHPEENVGTVKARRLTVLAYTYLEYAGLSADSAWRIDVIAVEVDLAGRVIRLEQIEYAVGER